MTLGLPSLSFQRAVMLVVEDLRRRSEECPNTIFALGCLDSAAETAADLIEACTHGTEWAPAAGLDIEFFREMLVALQRIQIDLERRSLVILKSGLRDPEVDP